ncbi:unnamed protein product [Rotaria socialis]|uniref:Calcineurin-like phosphoesterase domain-containing protein n=1 Tax=Rotaria socialis TaxID=392032 RepID=A0A817NS73_9BILA|nr:unnamed protein product [Rotaria socialis]CAF3289862.1 unnamed protein product [Rotaria socialis]CAF3380254.1 unnamed protein product [Rotaria socialis]CAF3620824.1 unnamed protein product [Rotaria socialis]CAF4115909.1 unnamed protein product [Rotaria socialis]
MAEMITENTQILSKIATRFVCISDNHDSYDFILPDGDILLHSGDITKNGTATEVETFLNWLKTLNQYRLKIVIVGNHESKRFYSKKRYKILPLPIEQLKNDKSLITDYGIVYLQDQAFQDPVTGWKFYGSGLLSEYYKNSEELRRHWSKIPIDTDILLTHGPPHSILDISSNAHHLGCKELLKQVSTVIQPKLHLFGHVHRGYGQLKNEQEFGRTLFINASLCDNHFRIAHAPIVVDLSKGE